ncbi:UPF0481 protein [Camellia lanceoleosa]|uniref:UPF0481 protein n=1 Tax=Camellia lanceoleosa TaxID=1840588 RepID=A0ACC0G8A5_9ERIC|nr:UPF0481 protein [Camellia lanceoleosa]
MQVDLENSIDNTVNLIRERLEENRREGITKRETISIGRVPYSLQRISRRATEPEMVSIGPYYLDDTHLQFQDYKLDFLNSLLTRTGQPDISLRNMTQAMTTLEKRARGQYSEPIHMSSRDFIQMMLFDGSFIIELFQQVCGSDDSANANSPVFVEPWLIPILIGDLLKLENQLPFFVLLDLYEHSIRDVNRNKDIFVKWPGLGLHMQALNVFNLALPRSFESFEDEGQRPDLRLTRHLLDLFYSSYCLPKRSFPNLSRISKRRWLPRLSYPSYLTNLFRRRSHELPRYCPLSEQSIPCVTRLRHAGVKFRPQQSSDSNFLHINFHKGVLEIPPVIINHFTRTILINCVAFEQCYLPLSTWKYFSEYIAFMNCLLNSSRDVTFLCDDGIISNSSYSDDQVADFFKKLGEHVVFNIRECYLKNEFREVEAYYSSNWATLRRTFLSSPRSTMAVVSSFVLLALTAIQTIIAILGYKVPHS